MKIGSSDKFPVKGRGKERLKKMSEPIQINLVLPRSEGKSASQRKTSLGSCKLHCKPSVARGQRLSTTQIKSRLI